MAPIDRRHVRVALTLVVIGLLVSPVVSNVDDFPLSTYPMYSSARPSEVNFVTAQGVLATGEVVTLGLEVIGATDDPLIAAGELRAAIRTDQAVARCREIAERVPSDSRIVSVNVVTERHDVIEHTLERPSVISRVVHAACPVGSPR
jgi:hypothetical protein